MANVRNQNFKYAALSNSNFSELDFTGSDFRYACLRNTRFVNAILEDVDFRYADLTDADLTGAKINQGTNFKYAILTGIKTKKEEREEKLNKIINNTKKVSSTPILYKCENCSAGLNDDFTCEYCGTKYHKKSGGVI